MVVTMVVMVMVVVMAVVGPVMQAVEGSVVTVEFQHHAVLDQRGAFIMMWTSTEDSIKVEIQVATKGWVGLGFSPNGGMRGADITLGWVGTDGQIHVHDRYAHSMTTPEIDIAQDVVVQGGYQNDTHTVIRFSRPWNTCDTKHDLKLSGDTMKIIWAYGEEDPVDEMTMEQHVERGTKSIYLREPRFTPSVNTKDIKSWDIRSPNITLPSNTDTLYWCRVVKVPDFNAKVHVIGFQPLISQENLPYVHHFLIYNCLDSPPHMDKWTQHEGVQCYTPNMPPSWLSCTMAISVAWAVGSEGEMWPEQVGVPLGKGTGVSHILMEVHYDNPQLKEGIVDNSGVRLFYTEKLREYDAGILATGHLVSHKMIVPPKQTWKTIGHCSDRCTDSAFPPDGIKVFQVFLHAHVLGRGLTVRHIRGGRELPVISQDHHYDFNYQQARILQQEVTVLPGDSLITECQYDARRKPVPTFGGEGTREEMCQAYLMYYPKVPMSICMSQPPLENIYRTLGVNKIKMENTSHDRNRAAHKMPYAEELERQLLEALLERKETPNVKDFDVAAAYKKVKVLEPTSFNNRNLYDILHDEQTWKDEKKMTELQKQIEFSPHEAYCRSVFGKSTRHSYKYPEFTTIKTLDDECSESHESQAYLPTQSDTEKQSPASLGLQPAVNLLSFISQLMLLILLH